MFEEWFHNRPYLFSSLSLVFGYRCVLLSLTLVLPLSVCLPHALVLARLLSILFFLLVYLHCKFQSAKWRRAHFRRILSKQSTRKQHSRIRHFFFHHRNIHQCEDGLNSSAAMGDVLTVVIINRLVMIYNPQTKIIATKNKEQTH